MHVSAHLDVDAVALEADELVTVMLQLDAPKAPETGALASSTPRWSCWTVPARCKAIA